MPTIVDWIGDVGPLWFPGLAAALAGRFDAGAGLFEAGSYCSAVWLGDSTAAHPPARRIEVGDRTAVLEDLGGAVTCGLAVAPAPWRDDDVASLHEALALLDRISGLTATLAPLARAIHRLEAPPDFDVSHSEPALPYSIFVSIPPTSATSAARLAESILHEAMHLQLSLIEAEEPLVSAPEQAGWSPWQTVERPVQGLLHGLYVSAVIHEVLGVLMGPASTVPGIDTSRADDATAITAHLSSRRRDIGQEVRDLPDFAGALHPAGNQLRARCLNALFVGLNHPATSDRIYSRSGAARRAPSSRP
jgi:HEXXH motif-containing protein